MGTFIGEDQFGNKSYENTDYFMARNRWVENNEKPLDPSYGYFRFHASQISTLIGTGVASTQIPPRAWV